MTDQEINEAVARKLGWELETMNSFYLNWWKNPKTKLFSKDPPSYCHSIEAAWEILQSVPKWEIKCEGKTVIVYLWSKATKDGFYQTENFQGVAGDTAPMAICLAFLKI